MANNTVEFNEVGSFLIILWTNFDRYNNGCNNFNISKHICTTKFYLNEK